MKIMTQDKDMVVDTQNADIFLDDDGTWYYVKISKGRNTYVLGGYMNQGKAKTELARIFACIKAKKDVYCMSQI